MDEEALNAALKRLVEELNSLENFYTTLEQQTHSNIATEEYKCRVYDTVLVHANVLLRKEDQTTKHKTYKAVRTSVFLEQCEAVKYLVNYYTLCRDTGTLNREECRDLLDDVAELRGIANATEHEKTETGLLQFPDGKEYVTKVHLTPLLLRIGERLLSEDQPCADDPGDVSPERPTASSRTSWPEDRSYLNFFSYSIKTNIFAFGGGFGGPFLVLWLTGYIPFGPLLFGVSLGTAIAVVVLLNQVHPGKFFRIAFWACLGSPFLTAGLLLVLQNINPDWATLLQSYLPPPVVAINIACAPLALVIDGVLTYFRDRSET